MCGIAGIFDPQARLGRQALADRAGAMARVLAHRGPDGQGVFADDRVGLGHRRLAIIDRSEAGSQPMSLGGAVLVFNGEIYNHSELRALLEREGNAPDWRGHSDTEILLACLEAWGVRRTLVRCRGMFALALWNPDKARLTLARDRFGEKPLYWAAHQGMILFGSEIKALNACPDFNPGLDMTGLGLYLPPRLHPGPAHHLPERVQAAPGLPAPPDGRQYGRGRSRALFRLARRAGPDFFARNRP